MNQALISCICITRNRPQLLVRALHCFDSQTYLNKELVLVLEEQDQPSIATVNEWNAGKNKPVKMITIPAGPEHKLGSLRNLGIEQAAGQYFCQWDDDDWYHPERLSKQYASLTATGGACLASVLEQWIIFDAVNQKSYLSCRRYWEGSILCDRNFALSYKYQNVDKGEDTPLVGVLAAQQQLQVMANHAYLYIYTFHGANTWDFRHFNGFIRYSSPLRTADNDDIIKLLQHNNGAPVSFLEKIH